MRHHTALIAYFLLLFDLFACQPEESTVIPIAYISGVDEEAEDYEDEQESQAAASKVNDTWVKLRLVFKEDDFEMVIQVKCVKRIQIQH